MGKRGPAPKPDSQRILEGNPSKRPLKGEPPKPRGLPTCPSWLSSEAKQEWRRVAPELGRLGLLTKLDRAALAGYCSSCAWWRRAHETLAREGTVYVTPRGQLKTRPEVEIARLAADSMKGFAVEFGLTPTSRARLLIPNSDSEDNDPMEQFFRKSEQGRYQ